MFFVYIFQVTYLVIHDIQSAQISQKQDGRNIYVIMKTMCPPGYHHNGFMPTHALGHMMYGSNSQQSSKFCKSIFRFCGGSHKIFSV